MGPCPNIHSVALRDQYEEANKKSYLGYEDEVIFVLLSFQILCFASYFISLYNYFCAMSTTLILFQLMEQLLRLNDDIDRKVSKAK
jgi:hypothetical protein